MDKKIIWVTGASSGIGRTLAKSYIDEGHYLIVSGRSFNDLKELMVMAPERVSLLDFDLADSASMDELPGRFSQITDHLDLVVLAAGTCEYVDTPACDEGLYRRVLETNYFAQVKCYLVALPLLRKSDQRAHLVGIGSLAAHLSFSRAQAYGASKAAFEYWLDCMRIDLRSENIDVTVVSPGFVDTPLTRKNDFAMPTLMTMESANKIILKGIEQRKRHVRFPWTLHWALALMSAFSGLWYEVVAPKLNKQRQL